jgi:hypothetical protein
MKFLQKTNLDSFQWFDIASEFSYDEINFEVKMEKNNIQKISSNWVCYKSVIIPKI